jgi:hypothetical protein
MSEKIRVDEDFVKSLIGGAAWRQEELRKELTEEVVEEAAEEVVEEEAHICPLCESHLAEEISDEAWDSHFAMLDQIAEEVDAEEEGEDLEEAMTKPMKKEQEKPRSAADRNKEFEKARDEYPDKEKHLGPQKGDTVNGKPLQTSSRKVKEMADGEEGDEEKPDMKPDMDEKKKKAMARVKKRMEAKMKK